LHGINSLKDKNMAEERKEKWYTYMALTTILIAVTATLSTFKGGGFSTRSLLNQTKASDQWAYLQAKSIKSYIFTMQLENLELQMELLEKQKGNEQVVSNYKDRIEEYKKNIQKYDEEMKVIKKDATSFENQRDESKKHSEKFGIAVIFLQISILLSSIATLSKKRFVWFCSLILGVLGIFYFLDGFFLFI